MTDVAAGYDHRSLDSFEVTEDKPATRWEISAQLDIEAYNLNVVVLEPGERMAQTAFHAHPEQQELYYVIDGRVRVETAEESVTAAMDDVVRFDPGEPHLLHNPFDASCKIVAISDPPSGHRPVRHIQSYEDLSRERYGEFPPELDDDSDD